MKILSTCFCIIFFFSACAGSPTRTQPDWIRNPYNLYDRQANVAAVGFGNNRQAAERNALGNLVAFFGQSIQVDETVSVQYREAVRNGVRANWSEDTARFSEITTSAGLDVLIGAEIGETWFDGDSTHYAAAFMNKTRAIQTYSELIRINQESIQNLINITADRKNTLEGFSRYRMAAILADVNFSYASLLSALGSTGFMQRARRGDEYRIEASIIAQSIPINVRVRNDREGRIQSAFAKVLADTGFSSGGINSRYILDVNISITPTEFPNNPNRFVTMEINANFLDASNGVVLLPYSYSNRSGHSTVANAENRAFLDAVQSIETQYMELMNNFLSQMLAAR